MSAFLRVRTAWGAVALVAAFGLPARGADDPAAIPPAVLQKAEAAYRDAFGPGHDKAQRATRPADKSDFAKRLSDAAAKPGIDAALQEVLRKYALQFAQPTDAVGLAVITDVSKAYLAFPSRRAAAMDKLGGLQEKAIANEPPATKLKAVNDAAKWYRDAAAEYEKQGATSSALAAVGKARAVLRKYTPAAKEALAALDADERRLQANSSDQADTERLRLAVEKNPDDAKSRLALGCRYLRGGRTREAADQFRAAGGDDWIAVAKALADTAPPDPETSARLLAKAAATLPPEDKKGRYSLFEYARARMDDARVKAPEKWPALLPAYAALLDRMSGVEPASQTARLSAAILFAQLDTAEAHAERGGYAEALFALTKARAAAKGMKPADAADFLPELAAMEKALKARTALDAEVEKLQADAASLDAKGQLALGVGLLRVGKLKAAAAPLRSSGVPIWKDVAALLAAPKENPLDLAHALRTAAGDLKGEERTDVLALARDRYEAFVATNPPDIEKTRVELIAGELPVMFSLSNRGKAIDLFTPENLKLFTEKGTGPGKVSPEGGAWALDTEYRNLLNAGWNYKVVERPSRPDEVRYVGFACQSEATCVRAYVYTAGEKYNGYSLGKAGGDPPFMTVGGESPRTAMPIVRDLFKDFGGGWSVVGLGYGSAEKVPSRCSAFVLGRSPEQVRRALARSVRE